jgi:hypothetical protein
MAVTTINIDSQVLTFANLAAFPLVGTVKTIYIAENTNFQYYWNGVAYELLTTLQTSGGGGASINYYLNGSINQGTISGVTYYEMNRTPILGLGTNFTLTNTNDYIASFLTDAGDPNQLNIPAGNWNCELYFNVSNNSGTPSFYIELYKYDGVTFTLIASSSTNPEFITNGTQVDLYTTAIPVPQTTLLATDRLAVRVHVNTSGNRTVTLHTEDNNLCQVITTFSTGLTALNGLIAQVQNFATGTSGTDFAINSVTDTHTFNLPTASALNRGALSSADWTIFNNKVPTGLITSSGLTMNTARLLGRGTAGSGAVEEIVIGSGLTLTGTTLSAAGSSYPNIPNESLFFDDYVSGFFNITANFSNPQDSSYLQLGASRINTINGGTVGAVGVLQCETQTSATASGIVGGLDMSSIFGAGEIVYEARVQIPTLSDSSERFDIRIGLDNKSVYDPARYVIFVYSDNVNSGKWQLARKNGGGVVTDDLGITVVAGTWYNLKLIVNAAGTSVAVYIDNVLINTYAGTLPNASAYPSPMFKWRKSVGTTNRNIWIDYQYCKQTLTTPR